MDYDQNYKRDTEEFVRAIQETVRRQHIVDAQIRLAADLNRKMMYRVVMRMNEKQYDQLKQLQGALGDITISAAIRQALDFLYDEVINK